MLKKIAIVYAIAAILVAAVSTILQTQPALFFIDLLLGPDNKFPISLTFLLTALVLLIPVILIIFFIGLFTRKGRNQVPDLAGKTGILVRRERVLSNGIYTDGVMINGEKKSTVSNGKKTFVELTPGTYKVFIKGSTTSSPVMELALENEQIVKLKTGYRPDGLTKVLQYLEHDQ